MTAGEDRVPAFERAIQAAVSRYAWIKHWEFWNEPEMFRYLGEAGTTYVRHLHTFYDIVRDFEHARFEYHPEHAGTEYEVLLIRDALQASGWLWPEDGSLLPAARQYAAGGS